MSKRRNTAKLGVLAIVLTLATISMTGATLARYVTEVNGIASATVAAWSFKANGQSVKMTDLNLASTAYSNVTNGKIAPGTEGSFKIELDGTGSEVDIDYTVAIKAASGTAVPDDLVFSTSPITAGNPGSKLAELSTVEASILKGTLTSANLKKDVMIYWKWDFGASDTTASNDNEYQGEKWELEITVTGEQQTPKATVVPAP